MNAVREVVAQNELDIESIVTSQEPVLLRGLVSHWPSVKASVSLEEMGRYLMSQYTGRPLTAYVGGAEVNGRFFYNDAFDDFNFKRGHATLGQVLNKISACRNDSERPTVYVGSTMIDEWFPAFNAENPSPIVRDDLLASLWIGNQSRVSAHYDFPDNIACVVAGRRRFTLFPPEQLPNLYVGPVDLTPSGQAISLVDINNPDYERFPKYREAENAALVADMLPGDALFIPSMWWHNVEGLDDLNVLVNYWWCESPTYLGAPSVALKHAMLAIKELPKSQREHWKRLFDYYVFETDRTNFNHIPCAGRGILDVLDNDMADDLKREIIDRLSASLNQKD
jgi:hypothetical protein